MKKVILGVLSAAVALSMCATTAFAACPGGRRYFVDADGDGICDNRGTYPWCGGNFIDADGDGVCDNCLSGQGWGCGHGRGAQSGRGR